MYDSSSHNAIAITRVEEAQDTLLVIDCFRHNVARIGYMLSKFVFIGLGTASCSKTRISLMSYLIKFTSNIAYMRTHTVTW